MSFRLKSGFSAKQLKCIEYMALGKMKQEDIAQEIGVNKSTISKWKKDQNFMEAILVRSRQILKNAMPEVYRSLTNGAKSGNDRHIKIFLDHIEKLEQIRAGQASVTFTWNPTTHTESDND